MQCQNVKHQHIIIESTTIPICAKTLTLKSIQSDLSSTQSSFAGQQG